MSLPRSCQIEWGKETGVDAPPSSFDSAPETALGPSPDAPMAPPTIHQNTTPISSVFLLAATGAGLLRCAGLRLQGGEFAHVRRAAGDRLAEPVTRLVQEPRCVRAAARLREQPARID